MSSALDLYLEAWRDGAARDLPQTVSDWAAENRVLSEIASSEPGRWRNDRTPYLVLIMDCLSPAHPARRVVVQAGAQLGKTECGNNWLGHIVHRTPGPMLYVEPTLDVVKKVSKQRIAPMIEASPALRKCFGDARTRDSGNTLSVKEFKGGLLLMTGANSAAGLRSMPIRFLFCDEVDEYPGDVEGQGDPVSLAEMRTATFTRRKVLMTSTPTIRGVSRIEREYLASNRLRYFIPCPECGHMDYLQWTLGGLAGEDGRHHHIVWEGHDKSSVRMCCAGCNAKIPESAKTHMLARGEWRSTLPEDVIWDGQTWGFHISSLYSPLGWKSWSDCAVAFWDCAHNPFKLKTWVNTVLGETWEEPGDSLDHNALKARLRPYAAEVPNGVGALVCSVDVQGDRLEAQVVGFGHGEESWLIDFEQLSGDPSQQATWLQLDDFRARTYKHESGRECRVDMTVIDSGGNHTEEVYRYCASRKRARPIKGGTTTGRPLVERPSNKNKYGVNLYVLCVDTGKDIVMGRLMQKNPSGPGTIHLPDWADDEYLKQLTAERAIRKYDKKRGSVRIWEKVYERNEALDLTVYALAGLYMMGRGLVRDLSKRAAKWSVPVKPEGGEPDAGSVAVVVEPEPVPPKPQRAARLPVAGRRGSWVGGWRK